MEFDSVRFYNVLVQAMSEAVICADAQGRIQFWNSGAVRIFGFSEPEAIGRSLDIIIPEDLRELHWAGFSETMRTGKSHYQAGVLLAVPALRKDGSRISVEFTVVPFRHEAGRMFGIAAVMRDVTARFEETKALRKQLAEAQKRLKDSLEIHADQQTAAPIRNFRETNGAIF